MPTSAIEGVLWPGCRALAPAVSLLGGITAFKTGYHGPRNWMKTNHPNDYSIQLTIDKLGPGDEGSALDWTFSDAQGGNFQTIAKFSKRLMKAGQDKDPRAYPLREFFGNTDDDRDVEGWSYYRNGPRSSDSSHLWHIHMSVWRKYINDAAAMRSILSILSGDEEDMPTAREIAETNWEWDGLPRPRDPITGNVPAGEDPTWAARTYLRNLYERVDTVEARLGSVEAKLDAILAKLP